MRWCTPSVARRMITQACGTTHSCYRPCSGAPACGDPCVAGQEVLIEANKTEAETGQQLQIRSDQQQVTQWR
jgi:hypothetical protein